MRFNTSLHSIIPLDLAYSDKLLPSRYYITIYAVTFAVNTSYIDTIESVH